MRGDRRTNSTSTDRSSDDNDSGERSPLLRAMRNSYHEETMYHSIRPANASFSSPVSANTDGNTMRRFRPIVFAEKSLAVLLNGVMIYVMCMFLGFGLVALNADNVLGPARHWNWWAVFSPFWVGNLVMVGAHVLSIRAATELRHWAETDTVSNEPLLPLLRKILLLYAVSLPLCILLFWAEIAFCAILNNSSNVSVYVAYAPIMIIEVGYVVRYLLCKSRTTLPGIAWILLFVFTLLLAHNSGVAATNAPDASGLPWVGVFAPLFVLQLLLFGSLVVVLYMQAAGLYKLNQTQVRATALYTVALVAVTIGQVMLVQHMEAQAGPATTTSEMDVPSLLLFTGWVLASSGLYLVCRQEVMKLMASRGGAVPVPLTRTAGGWVTHHAVVDRWMLLGDIALTDVGLARRAAGDRMRTVSDIEGEMNSDGYTCLRHIFTSTWLRWMCCLGNTTTRRTSDSLREEQMPEGRLKVSKPRRNSGSYSMVDVEITL
ncbi:hypothetical protein H310_09129 [Aphanomyces invadans]|nr:hypothetical protein H310_09129 [Aphanomyces invadans]ETV97776.1 hypothetical protein H310_09129 [Aphanomyces invadans]|eukprot:XP_008873337.1 hypothetical protein H310_09129 [Aphanomyces invadans]